MDLQNSANYKFYKCRSLLACDSGGMVYDRSKCFDGRSQDERSAQYSSLSQSEAGTPEKIIYIVDTDNQSKASGRSLVDLTTHLDDDEFNDYEMKTNMIEEYKGEAVHRIQSKDETNYLDGEGKYFKSEAVQNEAEKSVSDLVDELLTHEDNVAIHNSQLSQNSNNTNNMNYSERLSDSSRIDNSSVEDPLNTQGNLEYDFDPYKIEEVESYKNHMNKRKQVYNVKEDGDSELLDYNKSTQQNLVPSSKSKKKKLANNKENQRERLQSHKKNPFANVRMSSILKGKKSLKRSKSSLKEQTLESASNSSCSHDDESLIRNINSYQHTDSSSNSKDDILQEQSTVAQLNYDLANADYLDYVQPREQIIESNMDVLLTPTIENELSERIKTQQSTIEIKKLVDCNGNEVEFEDIQKMKTVKSVLSPSQIAERELFVYSAYAKKIGMENLFKTSNDAVINEIIFGTNAVCEQINLEFTYMKSAEETHLKQDLMKNSFIKSVSCTLLESLNELNRFGGFIDESSQETKSSEEISENAAPINDGFVNISDTSNIQKSKTHPCLNQLNDKKQNQLNSNFTFNFSNKSNLLGLDFQSRCSALEYLPKINHEVKRSPSPLIIKMKRINDGNNEYMIDASTKYSTKTNKKNMIGIIKNIERYECHDCAEKFRTKRNLKSHVSEYHKGPYDSECEICHMKCKKSSGHKKHFLGCPKSIVHKCNSCDRTYCYRASLLKHLKTHQR